MLLLGAFGTKLLILDILTISSAKGTNSKSSLYYNTILYCNGVLSGQIQGIGTRLKSIKATKKHPPDNVQRQKKDIIKAKERTEVKSMLKGKNLTKSTPHAASEGRGRCCCPYHGCNS